MTKTVPPIQRLIVSAAVLVLIAAAHILAPFITGYAQTMRLLLLFLFAAWVLFVCAQLFRVALSLVIDQKYASPLLMSLHLRGIVGTLWTIYMRREFRKVRLRAAFTVWSFVIMAVVVSLSFTPVVEDSELRFLRGDDVLLPQDSLTNTSIFNLVTADNNPLQYLRDLAGLVTQFRLMGARVVVAAKPPAGVPLEGTMAEEQRVLIDSIQNSGVAVLYENWSALPRFHANPGYHPGSALLPMFARETGSYPGSTLPVMMEPRGFWLEPSLQQSLRTVAVRWVPTVSNGTYLFANPALPAVSKYRGEPDSLLPVRLSNRVNFGGLSVPLVAGGEAVSLWGMRNGRPFLSVMAVRDLGADSLRFLTTAAGHHRSYPPAYAAEVRNRIIVIEWFNGTEASVFHPAVEQLMVIESLLRDRVLTKYEWLPFLCTAVMIALAALLCFRIWPGIAVPSLLGAALALFVISIWTLIAYHVLLNMSYASIALVLSSIIFPLVRMSHETT